MRAGALEDGHAVSRAPDKQPVASIGYMAFVAASPFAFEPMHLMALLQGLTCLFGVFEDKVDHFR